MSDEALRELETRVARAPDDVAAQIALAIARKRVGQELLPDVRRPIVAIIQEPGRRVRVVLLDRGESIFDRQAIGAPPLTFFQEFRSFAGGPVTLTGGNDGLRERRAREKTRENVRRRPPRRIP